MFRGGRVEALIPITMFMCFAAVMILRPISTKVGGLLEAITRERAQSRTEDANTTRIVALLEQMNRRLDQMEDRVDFTERLVSTRKPEARRQLHRAPLGEASYEPAAEPDFLAR
jgi:hypothetical protein